MSPQENERSKIIFVCQMYKRHFHWILTPFTGVGVESLIDIGSSGGQVSSDYVGVPVTLYDPVLNNC